ncbi:hypothetical protein TURU_010934 [Turdus rufiventris]|nr:hypothetical protein TURU_010934 [Turdus rufiventris]
MPWRRWVQEDPEARSAPPAGYRQAQGPMDAGLRLLIGMLGIEWAVSGKSETAGDNSFSGTAAVNKPFDLSGCQFMFHS